MFRWKLGFVFGERLILVDHVGRKSGRAYQTPVEVLEHDVSTHEFIVCSGTGPNADWYQNLVASPTLGVQVQNRRWPPKQRALDSQEATERFARYEQAHPRSAKYLLRSMGNSYDGTATDRARMVAAMPMIAFSDGAKNTGL